MPRYRERIEYYTELNKGNEPFLRGVVKERKPYGWTATILDLRPVEEREFGKQAELHWEIVDDDEQGRKAVEAFLRHPSNGMKTGSSTKSKSRRLSFA
jgi:hypothetical protein